ncbi:MAG TPA: 2,3-diaminopropionate biosynthesis protein SbnA [Thermoanaerobaculia bacterium]|nr:2,3-diaminopropionate biosynthesis protein SbnA [Thermoanaerobaculia bacterium]
MESLAPVTAPLPYVCEGVLEAIGETPLVRLRKVFPDLPFRLFGKLEALNPGGSIKDRPARAILETALDAGEIGRDTVVVESSSGNMGVGLAQACRYHGLRFICVVDSKTAEQNLRVLRAYGAEIECVSEPDAGSGQLLQARLERVRHLCSRMPNAFWPNQYANRLNPLSHYRTTMEEVSAALGGRVDYLFAATSTCGTIRGCGEYARDHGLPTRIIAVDAVGSLIFSDIRGERHIPGLGASIKPPLCDLRFVDRCVHVTDGECVAGCRRLVRHEAILAGGSAGGVIAAVGRMRREIPAGATCVALLCDRGERYLDTVYSDEWVQARFGSMPSDLEA